MGGWLGSGRSDAELAKLLRDQKSSNSPNKDKRAFERHEVHEASGQVLYKGTKTSCQVLEISLSGCRFRTQTRFRYGALAPVDVDFSIFGMDLHISGVTQWVKEDCLVGVRFESQGVKVKKQLEDLIARLIEQAAIDAENPKLAEAGEASAKATPAQPEEPKAPEIYDPAVHGGEGRVKSRKEENWKIALRSLDGSKHLDGSFFDLSIGGCTVRTNKPFFGEIEDRIEMEFELRGLHFLLSGVTKTIYDPQTPGIQFGAMSLRKREELAAVIHELGAPSAK